MKYLIFLIILLSSLAVQAEDFLETIKSDIARNSFKDLEDLRDARLTTFTFSDEPKKKYEFVVTSIKDLEDGKMELTYFKYKELHENLLGHGRNGNQYRPTKWVIKKKDEKIEWRLGAEENDKWIEVASVKSEIANLQLDKDGYAPKLAGYFNLKVIDSKLTKNKDSGSDKDKGEAECRYIGNSKVITVYPHKFMASESKRCNDCLPKKINICLAKIVCKGPFTIKLLADFSIEENQSYDISCVTDEENCPTEIIKCIKDGSLEVAKKEDVQPLNRAEKLKKAKDI